LCNLVTKKCEGSFRRDAWEEELRKKEEELERKEEELKRREEELLEKMRFGLCWSYFTS